MTVKVYMIFSSDTTELYNCPILVSKVCGVDEHGQLWLKGLMNGKYWIRLAL